MEIVVPLIQSTLSSNTNTRNAAEARLQELCNQNFASYAGVLAQILVVEEIEAQVRQSAGLILKNILSDKDAELEAQPWNKLDPNVRLQIKGLATQALGSHSIQAGKSAAQVVSKIGLIELSSNQWPELIPLLLQNVKSTRSELKISSLETIGYICEEIDPAVVSGQSNNILTAVIQGMVPAEPDLAVRLSATKALNNALVFVKTNFDNQLERNFIMQTICETCVASGEQSSVLSQLKLFAYECLVKVAEYYYDYLTEYMNAIAQLTFHSIQKEEESLAKLAIEFWCTIGDEEIDRMTELEYADDPSLVERHSLNFIKMGVTSLVPLLLQKLTHLEEDNDDDNIASSAGTCLSIIANACRDDIIPLVLPFVQTGVQSQDWKLRAGAIYAFGYILEGPSHETVSTLVKNALGLILQSISKNNHEKVKKSSAWTLSRVCEFHGTIVQENLPVVINVLVEALSDEPVIASNCCWAIYFLSQEIRSNDGSPKPTNPASPYFTHLIKGLLICTSRDDLDEANLRIAAYEAINAVIRASAEDTLELIAQLIEEILSRLNQTFQMTPISAEDKEEQVELQGLLIGILTSIIHQLNARIEPYAEIILQLFHRVFTQRSASVHEEALMGLTAMITALGNKFSKYVDTFMPFVKLGLQNHLEFEVCNVAVGTVGDLSRALDRSFEKYSDEIVTILLQNLSDPKLDDSVKPAIFGVLGDIALAVRGKFVTYLNHVIPIIVQACQITVEDDDEDVIEYVNELRQSIFDALVGIVQGLGDANRCDALVPHLGSFFGYIQLVARDESRDIELLRSAVSLTGDLCALVKQPCAPYVKDQTIQAIINEAIADEIDEGKYAREAVTKLIGGQW
eukprot:c21387_g2_i1.p1 GENE.c21387_g2_i1~~c21387_g2_i1.p1  ORF type:complete len:856 (-),score=317.86 c21387_g2_i1:49-2616(-)